MKNKEIERLVKELERLNHGINIRFEIGIYPAVIIVKGCSDCTKLNLPKDYCYKKTGLCSNNKNDFGHFEYFDLMTEDDYLRLYA